MPIRPAPPKPRLLMMIVWLFARAPAPAADQFDISQGDYGVVQTGDGTIIIKQIQGIPPADYRALAAELGVTQNALQSFFTIIEQEQVPLRYLDTTLRQIARLMENPGGLLTLQVKRGEQTLEITMEEAE